MSILSEQIRRVKDDIRALRKRLQAAPSEKKAPRIPHDPEFDTWRARSRRAQYLRIIRDDLAVPDTSPVSKRRSHDVHQDHD